ncbi:MAG TPA: redoxin domain-containing protein, partial [Planctomycetota bacterium]|nr:redoxin domain-containing protein [Planctomycetota bacterium]
LADLRGKTVVLEWFNPECPFVVYAHEDGPLKDMAKRFGSADLVWLAINSSAPGKQGSGAEKNRSYAEKWSLDHRILLDEDGAVGRRYRAKTTPHVYVVDQRGVLVYRGALDNAPRGRVKGESYTNYLEEALGSIGSGQPIERADTRPYGCSVKYGSK